MAITTIFKNWLTEERVLEIADDLITSRCLPPEKLSNGLPDPGPGYRSLGLYRTDQPYYQVHVKYASRFSSKTRLHRDEWHKGYDHIGGREVNTSLDVAYDQDELHKHRDRFDMMVPANVSSSLIGTEFTKNALAFRGERKSYQTHSMVAKDHAHLFVHTLDYVWNIVGTSFAKSTINDQLESTFSTTRILNESIENDINSKLVAHAVIPLWSLVFQVRDHLYFICINGQNGEVIAKKLPKSLETKPQNQRIADITTYSLGSILLIIIAGLFNDTLLWGLFLPGLILLRLLFTRSKQAKSRQSDISNLLKSIGINNHKNLLEE